MIEGKNGLTENTPKNIPFGPGTIHRNLKFADGKWNFAESIIGTTTGGSKLSIVPEIYRPTIDGVPGNVKVLAKKVGETVTLEVNFAELNPDIIKMAVLAAIGESEDTNFDLIEPKADIEEGDYLENIAFVGETFKGQKIIVIIENALCTSGFEMEGKDKEALVGKYTFECNADPSGDLDKMPWHIYYPKIA